LSAGLAAAQVVAHGIQQREQIAAAATARRLATTNRLLDMLSLQQEYAPLAPPALQAEAADEGTAADESTAAANGEAELGANEL
jgi:hypothetical protein